MGTRKAVLGLKVEPWHDTGAAVVVERAGGLEVVAISQERLDRCKHSRAFPRDAIEYCLDTARITLSEIDLVVADYIVRPTVDDAPARVPTNALAGKKAFFGQLDRARIPAVFAEHHLCHAASAFFASPFDEALALVVDGHGSLGETQTLFGCGAAGLTKLASSHDPGIGWLYSVVTEALIGFGHLQEGKTMGLAAWGAPSDEWRLAVTAACAGMTTDYQRFAEPGDPVWHMVLPPGLRPHPPGVPVTEGPAKDCAHAAQAELERVVLHLARWARDLVGRRANLCYAGGVALNVVANRLLLDSGLFEHLFIQPAASDSGIPLGAALLGYHSHLRGDARWRMRAASLGRDYGADRCADAASTWEGHVVERAPQLVAQILSNDYLLGWFQGGSEYGPRALGRRSILAAPQHRGMKDYLNLEVKHREPFRPFAPIVAAEDQATFFDLPHESPYMLLNARASLPWASRMPAVVHVDGTARVQSVLRDWDPDLHALLEAAGARTGLPVLLNTSLNLAGEPIVETPLEAVDLLRRSGLHGMVIDRWLLTKDDPVLLCWRPNPDLAPDPERVHAPAALPDAVSVTGGLTRHTALIERVREAAASIATELRAPWVVYGAGEVGRAVARALRDLGPAPVAFVESEMRPVAVEIDGWPVWTPERALDEGVAGFVLGTLSSAAAMRARLGRAARARGRAVDVWPPDGLPIAPGEEADASDLWTRVRAGQSLGRTVAEFAWLEANKVERMDADMPVNPAVRRAFHVDRYEFAATFATGARVLDCASGTGYGSARLAAEGRASSVVGVDVDEAATEYARRHFGGTRVSFVTADASRLDGMAPGSIDLVASFETVEHVPDDRAMLGEFCRVLRSNGRLVISTPNDWPVDVSPFHVRSYDLAAFRRLLEERFHAVDVFGQWPTGDTRSARIAPIAARAEPPECLVAVCTGVREAVP